MAKKKQDKDKKTTSKTPKVVYLEPDLEKKAMNSILALSKEMGFQITWSHWLRRCVVNELKRGKE